MMTTIASLHPARDPGRFFQFVAFLPFRRWTVALLALCLSTFAALPNSVPVATPQSVPTFANGALPITLAGTDAEGDPLLFLVVSPPFRGVLSGQPPNLFYTPTTNFVGNDNLWFVVRDATGTSAPAPVVIALNAPTNAPPSVSLNSPLPNASLPASTPILLTATAADADGTVTRVDFLDGLTLIGTSSNAPYSLVWNGAVGGTHTIIAKAFDNRGARTFATPVVVNVAGTPPTFGLTVVGGTGAGTYAAGTQVFIAATVPAGKTFVGWSASGAGLANATSASTLFQMPSANATVTAAFSGSGSTPTPVYTLTVLSGAGGGTYAAGSTVTVTASAAPSGQTFASWSGVPVANASATATTLVMPAANAVLTASYKPLSPVTLTVNGGSGSGLYTPGTTASILANPPSAGLTFDRWIGGPVRGTNSPRTVIVLPGVDVILTATYKPLPAPTPIPGITNAILFVTQVPVGTDFTTIGSVFGNHHASVDHCARGGDLYIRHPDGALKNLTAAAGFGSGDGFQGIESIAVRDPAVHWDGTKALFSMVVGTPAVPFQSSASVWQVYEVTGMGANENPVIARIPNQPSAYNNVSPCYGTDGRILFTSDRPRDGRNHLYPQLDEYELSPSVSGLWSLDPTSGDLVLLDHSPSGDFTPTVDSFGRVLFTRWDHLQQDQEADFDRDAVAQAASLPFGTFNYSNESTNAVAFFGVRTEVFPEPRQIVGSVNRHVFNFFFPWMIREDGTEAETLNHVGRQELAGYFEASFLNDPNLRPFFNPGARYNTNYANLFLQLKEDPRRPGIFFCVDSPEFSSHASGQIMTLDAPPTRNASQIRIGYITHPATKGFLPDATTGHTGHYREPLPLSDGTLVAVHTPHTDAETRRGFGADYQFRLKTLKPSGSYWVPDQPLTSGFSKSVTFLSGGGLATYSGPLWELNPVEVRARAIPVAAAVPLPAPERRILDDEGVDVNVLQDYLRLNDLALIVSRNVTTRDAADRQQPYNLRVAGTTTQTLGANGKVYDVARLQVLQGDLIRGFGMYQSNSTPRAGRRVLAQPLHDDASLASNGADPAAPAGSVELGPDGSMAAFVPARRALTWQLIGTNSASVVRERYWLTFQPGEIRSCTSCHGINTRDQANQSVPLNPPEALRSLLQSWKIATGVVDPSAQLHAVSGAESASHVPLRLHGSPVRTQHLETSRDLVHWTRVRRVKTDVDGLVNLRVQAATEGQRYYRLAE